MIRLARRPRFWLAGVFCALVVAGLGAWWFHNDDLAAQMLRAEADTLPRHPALMAFGISHGRAVFGADCAGCHGPDAKGNATLGIPNLTDADWLYGFGRINDIQQTVRYGIRAQDPRGWNLADMPAFARPVPYAREALLPLSPGDVSDVVQFLFARANRPADFVAAARGQKIFDGRGACWDCHGEDARGDSEIGAPNLTDRIWLYGDGDAASISQAIENGRAGVCPAWAGRISAADILEVSLYVYSLSHVTTEAAR